jgi:hypothetical protein
MAGETTIRHGYTLTELHRMASRAASLPAARWLDARDAYDAAWHGLVEALLTATERPAQKGLTNVARQAVANLVKDEYHHHGIPVDRPWAGHGAMPQFARYWWHGGRREPDPAPGVVDRLAVLDIWPKLTAGQRAALTALAATDDYQAAAAMLGIGQRAFNKRVETARRGFLRWWHEGEVPSEQWRLDRRWRPARTEEVAV